MKVVIREFSFFVAFNLAVAREPHTAERTENAESAGVNAG